MQKTKDSISIKILSLPDPRAMRRWLYLLLAVALALGGWLLLSRLFLVGASVANRPLSNGGQTHIWPTEVINSPMASGRSFINITNRSLAYYTNKDRTFQQLHLAYGGGNNLYYAKSDWPSSWNFPRWTSWVTSVVTTTSNMVEWVSIAVDYRNRPHIAYYSNGCLRYQFSGSDQNWINTPKVDCDNTPLPLVEENMMLFDDLGWVEHEPIALSNNQENGISSLAELTSGAGKYTSIAIDSDGRPHISYAKFYRRSDRNYHKLKYAYFDGAKWNIEMVYENKNMLRSLNEGLFTSIAIDSRDRPHIAFLDDDHDKLRYSFSPRAGSWTFSYPIPPDDSRNVGGWTSLILRPGEPQDKPFIAFYDKTNGALMMAEGAYDTRIQNYTWKTYQIDNNGDVGLSASLAIKDGKDFGVSYFDETSDSIRFASGNSKNWNIETVSPSSTRTGRYSSLVFDFNQKPHIVYFDLLEGMFYEAYQITTTWNIRKIPTPFSEALEVRVIFLPLIIR